MQSAADMVGMLTPSQRIVFLDADQVVLKNIDDLFDIEIPQGWIAAVQDCRCEHNRLNPPIEVERGVCPYVAHDQDGPTFKLRFQSSRLQHCLQAGLLVIDPATELLDMLLHTLNTDPIVKDFRAPVSITESTIGQYTENFVPSIRSRIFLCIASDSSGSLYRIDTIASRRFRITTRLS